MANEATAQDTGVTEMADFIAKHGSAQALESIQENPTESAATTPSASDNALPPSSEEEQDQSEELDAATLQALGLAEEEESPPSQDDATDDGTEQSGIDLASLAKTLGMEASDLALDDGELKLTTKVDGERAQVSVDELRKGYQLQKHFTKQNEEFLQQKQAWEASRQAQEAQAQQLANIANSVLDAEETALNSQYTRNWEQLRQDDPAEYAAQVADYNQKLNQIKERKSSLASEMQQRQVQAQQEQQQAMQQAQMRGQQVLAEELGWKDAKAFEEGGQRLRRYMVDSLGFAPQEIDAIVDPRPFLVSEKARKYDEIMAKVDLTRKKVVKTHKTPAGVASKPTGGQQRKLDAAKARLAKTHSEEAAADVFKHLKGIL